ncbi:MAG TPA: thiamine-phosphate kinase [Gemmatimonadales bacterium]
MSPHLPLGPGREFDRIRRIAAKLGARARGLGDDCALIPPGLGELVSSTDLAIEDVHFRQVWLGHEEIGWRAAMGALSDLAAAGAQPVGLLAALALPATVSDDEVDRLMVGLGDAGSQVGAPVLGGDLSRGPCLALAVTGFGRAERPLSRSGAARGDGLWVTGHLGGARAALTLWSRGERPDAASRQAFARPRARIAAGRWLASHGARAMIDLSDGLAGDVRHLAAASAVGVVIQLELLPLHESVARAAGTVGEPPAAFAAKGGEDYELLVALPGAFTPAEAAECERETGVPLTRIGAVTPGSRVRLLLEATELALGGFDHFG